MRLPTLLTARVWPLLLLPATLVACPPAPAANPTPSKIKVQSAGFALAEVNQRVRYQANGATGPGYIWKVNGVQGGSTSFGVVDQSGLYVAPASVPNPAEISVQACDSSNPSDCGEAKLTIVATGSAPGIFGKITVPAGLLPQSTSQISAQSIDITPPKPFAPDWNALHSNAEVIVLSSPTRSGLRPLSASINPSSISVPTGQSAEGYAAALEAQGYVVQPNYLYRTLEAPQPNDPLYGQKQFHLTQIDATGAWGVTTTAAKIAVIDTGADFNHPDLQGRIIKGKDFCPSFDAALNHCVGEDADPSEGPSNLGLGNQGHGTHTVGIIAAASNNGVGVTGLAWAGEVLVVKVFDGTGEYTDSATLAKAIQYAVDQGVKVINLSLGFNTIDLSKNPDKLVSDSINYADSKDVLVVAAAGNHQPNVVDKKVFYPASDALVVPVGSVDPSNIVSVFSARGDNRLLMTPGQGPSFTPLGEAGIWSTKSGGGYEARYGTSEATPQVAAIAALVRAQNTGLTALQTRGILETTAKDLGDAGRDGTYGFGLLQAGAALRKAAGNINAAPPVKTTVYIYADRLVDGVYNGDDLKTGRAEVILDGPSGVVNYKMTLTRDGSALPTGTYRVVACVNKNSNGFACDTGDLFATQENVQYAGSGTVGVDLTVHQK